MEGLSLDLNQRIDTRFSDEQVIPVHLQHDKSVMVKGDQADPLGLRLSSSVGVHHQVCAAKYDDRSPRTAQPAIPRLTSHSACRPCACRFSA